MTFPFEQVYNQFAKKLDGETALPPFGPFVFMIQTHDGKFKKVELIRPILIMAMMGTPGGHDALQMHIDSLLKAEDNNFCVVMMHETLAKTLKDDPTPDEAVELKKRGLVNDPDAKHVVLIRVHHTSGVLTGMLPLAPDRTVTYAKPTGMDSAIYVDPNPDNNLH